MAGAPSWALWSPGRLCPFRHDHGEKTVVCKHWLRGLCKKGDQCRFLHQYDLSRMPECYFFSKFGEAPGSCPFPGDGGRCGMGCLGGTQRRPRVSQGAGQACLSLGRLPLRPTP